MTLHAEDWTALALSGLSEVAEVAGETAAEAVANADVDGDLAVQEAIDAQNAITTGAVDTIAPFGEFGNVAPDLDAVYQAAYDASIEASGVTTSFMGVDLTNFCYRRRCSYLCWARHSRRY